MVQRILPPKNLPGNQESQERASERPLCQRDHSGRMVGSRCSCIRGIPFGRYGSLSRHAKRGRRSASCAREKGLAILTTKQVEVGPEEVEFELKTAQGQSLMQKRYLVQLGDVPVTHKCSAPKGGAVEADAALVVVDLTKKHCHPDAWKTALTRPKSATAHWLKKLGVVPVDFLPPRSGGNEGVEVVARVQRDSFEKVLRGSGEFGVFSRHFYVKGDSRAYKDVPLPDDFDLQVALRRAKAVRSSIFWVVLCGMGFGLRTKECDFECVVGQVFSEEDAKRFIGERLEAIDLPLSWSKAAVQAFLAGCSWTVEASFRAGKTRSATIRAAEPLPHRRLQHDFGCALLRPAEPRKRPRAQVLVWSTPGKTTAEGHRGDPTPPVAAKRSLAGSESMDMTVLGAISPTLVQDCNQAPTQVSLSPRSHRMDALQPQHPQCWQVLPRSFRCSRRRCSR